MTGTGPTRWRSLLVAAVVGAGLVLLGLALVDAAEMVAPELPWSTPVLLGLAAAAGVGLARLTSVRNRLPGRRPDPTQAVATLALARAMMLAGAAFTGGYLAFALAFVPRWDAPLPRARVVLGLVSAVASAAVALAGWGLELACRVPRDDDRDGGGGDTT